MKYAEIRKKYEDQYKKWFDVHHSGGTSLGEFESQCRFLHLQERHELQNLPCKESRQRIEVLNKLINENT